jgi:hypothetical protein
VALRRMVVRLGIHRSIETVVGIGPTMLLGMALVALSMVVMLKATATATADPLAREDLAFALSVVLLGLLMMVTRRNAVSQVVGFMSLENGTILAATGAKGMPLVVEISVAFSVLIAFIVIGVFLFRIRERFDSVDIARSTPSAVSGDDFHRVSAALRRSCRGAGYPRGGGHRARSAARLLAERAPERAGIAGDVAGRADPVRRAPGAIALSLRRRSQHRLRRARHLRRLHHQRFQRQLHRPRAGDRQADAAISSLLSRHVPDLMFAMNLGLIANNIGLMWVAIEIATLTTVLMVGIYRTHEALEAAWKYFILGSVGIALACSAPFSSTWRRGRFWARARTPWCGRR